MQDNALLLDLLEQQKQMISMLQNTIGNLNEQVAFLTQKLYGRKSEQSIYLMDGQQMIPDVFNEAEATADSTVPEPEILEKPLRHTRSRLPASGGLCQSASGRSSLHH